MFNRHGDISETSCLRKTLGYPWSRLARAGKTIITRFRETTVETHPRRTETDSHTLIGLENIKSGGLHTKTIPIFRVQHHQLFILLQKIRTFDPLQSYIDNFNYNIIFHTLKNKYD